MAYVAAHRLAPGATKWTLASGLRRASHILRSAGPRTLWFQCLGEICYRRLWLLEHQLDPVPSSVKAALPVTITVLDDPKDYAAFRPDAPQDDARRLMDVGGRCFVAVVGDCIVSGTWVFDQRAPVPYLGAVLDGGPDSVVLYDSWTVPHLRGRGLSPAVGSAVVVEARDRGRKRVLTPVLPENGPSLAARAKVGFRVVATAGCLWTRSLKRHFIRHTRAGDSTDPWSF